MDGWRRKFIVFTVLKIFCVKLVIKNMEVEVDKIW